MPVLIILHAGSAVYAGTFYAYYTKVDSGRSFEHTSRTGPYADIVVKLDKGKFVFWRGSSYLPYWQTSRGKWFVEEVIERKGDGPAERPDKVNTYSHVDIIENRDSHVTVLWRYLPKFGGTNPHTGVHPAKFVEELFTICPDGSVTRVIRKATQRYDDWVDRLNRTTQRLVLTDAGIIQRSSTPPASSPEAGRVSGSPLKQGFITKPARYWRFDEGAGETTVESTTGARCRVLGHTSFWKKGVSGTALHFDGYNTLVSLKPGQSPEVGNALTLSGWIAIGAYPWNWTPIIQQGDDKGYFLGISGHGKPGLKIQVGDRWEELTSDEHLERNRWYHVVGVFDGSQGLMRLYVDGKQSGAKRVNRGEVRTAEDPIQIGKGKARRPIDPVRANTFVAPYSFDGLIDEVGLHTVALSAREIDQLHKSTQPSASLRRNPDMPYRSLPQVKSTGRFGARYTHLKFYETWDSLWRFGPYPDVVVEFDRHPTQFVFWRGTCFIPMLVNENGQWYSNEFNETWGRSGGKGCQEPMSDKESYSDHARIIENTEARVVVHWRFPLKDVLHVVANYDQETGWGDWADWYYYIYPDGVAVKTMHLWTDGPRNHEWQESMAILGPNQHPEQVLETDPALILADLEGRVSEYAWVNGPPRGVSYRNKKIHIVNYRAEYDPFTIGDFQRGDVYSGEVTAYSVFPSWNHWPVAQMPSDGRYAGYPDRTAHSSLTHVRLPTYRESFADRPFQSKILMEGMTNQTATQLIPLAKSWLQAPALRDVTGASSRGYDPSQRAYVMAATGQRQGFSVDASPSQPLVNLCVVVANWNCDEHGQVTVNGELQTPNKRFRQGIVRDPEGRQSLVVWLELESTRPVQFTITGARPRPLGVLPGRLQWRERPRVQEGTFSVTMAAESVSGTSGAEYLFECVAGGGHSSSWQSTPAYTDVGLSPATGYTYRVKARDRYFDESDWSEPLSAKTPAAPAPVIWTLDQVSNNRIADEKGRYYGVLTPTVSREPGRIDHALRFDGDSAVVIRDCAGLRSSTNFTWTAWIKTTTGGSIIARCGKAQRWQQGGKVLFVDDGRLQFDVGWVGAVSSNRRVNDGKWHHVAVTVASSEDSGVISFYVDGQISGSGSLDTTRFNEAGLPVKIGFCNRDFPSQSGFAGLIDDVRWYGYPLSASAMQALYEGYGPGNGP